MTGPATATVEVLTAEVRVLMVGSRQVTLSVYNQLDHVRPDDIDPFGRVRPRDAEPGWVCVVGASKRDTDRGTLVRSWRETSASLMRQADRLRGRGDMIEELADLRKQAKNGGWTNTAGNRADQLYLILAGETRTVADLYDEAGDLMAKARDAAPWSRLPLIVLAGLR
jgi:hypothetical protein